MAGRHEVVETLPVLAVLEDHRRAGQQLVAVLLGPDDPVVGDALQRKVLAVCGALDDFRSASVAVRSVR